MQFGYELGVSTRIYGQAFLVYVALLLPHDARSVVQSARIAIASRSSVRLSVTLGYCGRIGWASSKVIARLISLGSSLLGAPRSTILLKGNIHKIRME